MSFVENLIAEKRRESLHNRECRGMGKLVILWSGWGVIFKSFLALPEDRDAFLMQMGISQRGRVLPSLHPACP
jgi:hypothetical protein